MASFVERVEAIVFPALRIIAGTMFLCHGVQKLFGFWTDHPPAAMSQLWIGGIVELVCGTLIALGWFARPAAFLASGQMAVAYSSFTGASTSIAGSCRS